MLALAVLLLQGAAPDARATPNTEAQVKAAFVLNFLKFIEWPAEAASSNAPLVILIPRDHPLGDALASLLDEKTAQERRIRVERDASRAHLRSAHVILFPDYRDRPPAEVLEGLGGLPILTIGDAPGFADAGGIIGFTWEQTKLRFEINLDAAQAGRLRIRSQLLNLARRVVRQAPPQKPPRSP